MADMVLLADAGCAVKIYLRKGLNNSLYPANEEAMEFIKKVSAHDTLSADVVRPRNYLYHKKFFAMIQVGFDAWEPADLEHKGLPVQKNFERFRKDCIIAAGFYEAVVNLKGEVRAEAKSISFANMEETEFNKVYIAVVDVLLQKVLRNYTRADIDMVVDQILQLAA